MKALWKKWRMAAPAVLLAMLAGCEGPAPAYPPPLFERRVDVSKPGLLYEGDFTVPYNGRFAPEKLEFGQSHTHYELVLQIADTVPGRFEREEKEADEIHRKTGRWDITHISLWKVIGFWGDLDYFGKMSAEQQSVHIRPMEYPGAPIQLKITLTPHPGASKPIRYVTGPDYGTGRGGDLVPGEALDITLDLSTFAEYQSLGGFLISTPKDKLLLRLPRLELHGNYHLRVENLMPVTLPAGIETTLILRPGPIAK